MVKRIKKITKGRVTRERKKVIVVGTEGLNKTEILYFKELEKKQDQYHCIFAKGNETDPIKIVRNTAKRAREEELSYREGDMAVSIFDLDVDEAKYAQLKAARESARNKNVKIIASNPCFEIWYLEHFGFSTKPFISSSEAVKELRKKIPGYTKNSCDFEILYPSTEEAISNCEKLDQYHAGNNNAADESANPRTDVYKLVRVFIGGGGDKR